MRKIMKFAILAVTGLAASACASDPSEPFNPDPAQAIVTGDVGQTFELRVGQFAHIGDSQLQIGFQGVTQDSRCPVDVTCVWAGDAALRVHATIAKMAWTPFTLHTNLEPRSTKFRDYTITVVGLKPDPRSDEEISTRNYVVTLRVD